MITYLNIGDQDDHIHLFLVYEKQMSTLKEERDRLASQVKEMTDELARIKDLMANSQTSLSGFENERNSLKVGSVDLCILLYCYFLSVIGDIV